MKTRRHRYVRTTSYAATCPRCHRDMPTGTPFVLRKGEPIHTHCAPGADDE